MLIRRHFLGLADEAGKDREGWPPLRSGLLEGDVEDAKEWIGETASNEAL